MRDFARLRRREQEDYIEKMVGQHSTVTAQVDATALWRGADGNEDSEDAKLTAIVMKQRIKVPLGEQDTLEAHGTLLASGTKAGGSLGLNLEHAFSPNSHVSVNSTFSPGASLVGFRGWRKLTPHSEGLIDLKFPIGGEPSLELVTSRILTKRGVVGTAAWRVAPSPSYRVDVRHSEDERSWSTAVQLGQTKAEVSASLMRKWSKKLSGSGSSSAWIENASLGFNVQAMLLYRVSHLSSAGIGFNLGSSGAALCLQYVRHGQKVNLPIRFADQLSTASLSVALLLPAALAYLSKLLIFDPISERKQLKKLERLRREREEHIRQQKEKAESYRQLMEDKVAQKREEEEGKNGLVIVHAIYGKLPDKSKQPDPAANEAEGEQNPFAIDVSIPLQFLVENSQLHLHPQSKAGLIGFYDPCPGEDKHLEVIYLFKNKIHRCITHDLDPLRIPLQSHLENQLDTE
jgi:DnaJ homolog subfamily C member 11